MLVGLGIRDTPAAAAASALDVGIALGNVTVGSVPVRMGEAGEVGCGSFDGDPRKVNTGAAGAAA